MQCLQSQMNTGAVNHTNVDLCASTHALLYLGIHHAYLCLPSAGAATWPARQ